MSVPLGGARTVCMRLTLVVEGGGATKGTAHGQLGSGRGSSAGRVERLGGLTLRTADKGGGRHSELQSRLLRHHRVVRRAAAHRNAVHEPHIKAHLVPLDGLRARGGGQAVCAPGLCDERGLSGGGAPCPRST